MERIRSTPFLPTRGREPTTPPPEPPPDTDMSIEPPPLLGEVEVEAALNLLSKLGKSPGMDN